MNELLQMDGFLRLNQIVGRKPDPKNLTVPAIPAIIPISKSSWLSGVKNGKYPKPIKLSERIVVWRASDIRKLIEDQSSQVS